MSVQLSVVVPARDGDARLPATLRGLLSHLQQQEQAWEVLVVDAGSSDQVARAVAVLGDDRVRLIRRPVSRGKGHAARVGVLASRGARVLMCDAGSPTPLEELPRLHDALEGGASVAIGSRQPPSPVRKHPLREWCGRIGTGLIQLVTLPGIQDASTGFKLYDGPRARLVFQRARLDGSSDAEVLHLFRRLGLQVVEVPVRWSDHLGSN
ncbi:glycosyl transferase family 2 [Kribbella voronezhensis]|uniref:Glycosyl transferase family 2 n=1 Tax=Kribbella voronezhensis TaxID=2512212 RepID=A0A4R7TFR7_9ACTN|nr:glycosyltransferase [Kribbella voronezhensis]TDU90257.1 glycosyl transferase family 2 [Kribbella voronezhensis]